MCRFVAVESEIYCHVVQCFNINSLLRMSEVLKIIHNLKLLKRPEHVVWVLHCNRGNNKATPVQKFPEAFRSSNKADFSDLGAKVKNTSSASAADE